MRLTSRLIFVILAVLGLARTAEAQAPVYFASTPDEVTGDNPPVVIPGVCPATDPCYISDPGADSYLRDIYERPMGRGGDADEYHPGLDIVMSRVGYDQLWLYYRIDLYGTGQGTLHHLYGFEINYDDDGIGDIFVTVNNPGFSTTWTNQDVEVFWDQDNNVGALYPTLPEGPGGNGNGYENLVFKSGLNKVPGSPGGVGAVKARVAPDNPASVELAVNRAFMEVLRGDRIDRAAFRPFAGPSQTTPSRMYFHDELSRAQIGSPYPWLSLTGAPSTCVSSPTPQEEAALESGVNYDTGIPNPCFPVGSQSDLMDNSGDVSALSQGTINTINFYTDIALTKTAADTVQVGDTIVYSILVDNQENGFGSATGVTIFDSLPDLTTFVSASPSQGSCGFLLDVLVCEMGTVANRSTASVSVRAVGDTVATVTNVAWVVSDPTDRHPSDDRAEAATVVISLQDLFATPDGGPPLLRLPSNGAPYTATFQVEHNGDWPADILLQVVAEDPTILAVDSVGGTGVTAGPTPDSAQIVGLAPSTPQDVEVYFRVLDVARTSSSSLTLQSSVDGGTAADSAWSSFSVIRPDLAISKSVVPSSDISPGTDLAYTMSVTNNGDAPADSVSILDLVSSDLEYKLASAGFSLPAGITATIDYSSDGATWTYTPTSTGCGAPVGYDGCVTQIRWTLSASLGATGEPDSAGELNFTARVR